MASRVRLADVCGLTMGLSPDGGTYNNEGVGLPLLNGPTEFGPTHPSSSLFTNDPKRICHPGALLFCVRGNTTGRMNWADQEYAIGRGLAAIATSTPGETQFIRYALEHELASLLSMTSGSTMPMLRKADIENFEIHWPENRLVVSSILNDLDVLADNNRRRIELLEETARLLYREWFVNFRYPGHEDVPLVDSELGPIPEGWEVRMVGSVCELIRGRSYKRAELVDLGGLPFLNLKCVSRGGGFRLDGIKRYQGSFKPTQKTYPGETVIAMTDMTQDRGVVAQAARVPHLDEGFGVISLDLNRVIPNPGVDPDYLYAMFRHSAFSKAVREFANGVNVLHLSPSSIESYNFALPPDPLQKLFGDSVRPGLKLVDRLQQQSETLAEARDLLLPRLVSGDLDISDLDLDLGAVG